MSFVTLPEGVRSPPAARARSVARRTVRDALLRRPFAIATLAETSDSRAARRVPPLAMPTTLQGVGASAVEMPIELGGELHAHYEPVRWLARGSEADVWLLRRRSDGTECVLKWYFPGVRPAAGVLDAMTAKSGGVLPRLHEYGLLDGRQFEVWEHVVGGTLREQLRFGRLDPLSARYLLRDMTEALLTLHDIGVGGASVIHGDVKPENILLRSVVPPGYTLCDFGVSLCVPEAGQGYPTRRGHTPHYCAPEFLYVGPIPASDFWSLGMVLLEALSGTHPLAALSSEAVHDRLRSGWRPELSQELPAPWRRLLAGLLQPDPQLRWGGDEVRIWLRQIERSARPTEAEVEGPEQVFATAHALAEYLATHWSEGLACLRAEEGSEWLASQIASWLPAADWAALRRDVSLSADVRLLRLIYRLAPNLPPIWQGWAALPDDIAVHCVRAREGDMDAHQRVSTLLELDVLQELGRLTGHPRLTELGRRWREAWQDYQETRAAVAHLGAPIGHLPGQGQVMGWLYLLLGWESLPPVDSPPIIHALCTSWIIPLMGPIVQRRPGVRLLAALLLPWWQVEHPEHLRESCELESAGNTLQGTVFLQQGRDPPVVSLRALHAPIYYTICDERLHIGNRIRLSWQVSGARWIYLLGEGLVPPQGQLERATASPLRYMLLAIGRGGVTFVRLPGIDGRRFSLVRQLSAANLPRHRRLSRA